MRLKKVRVLGGAVIAIGLFVVYQNCGNYQVMPSFSSQNHASPHITTTATSFAPNTDLVFFVFRESLSSKAEFFWSHDFSAGSCNTRQSPDHSEFTVNCGSAGNLEVSATVTDGTASFGPLAYQIEVKAGGASPPAPIPLSVDFVIPNGTGPNTWNTQATLVEVFVGQTLVLKNMDSTPGQKHALHTGGRPCPHGADIPVGGSVNCVITQSYDAAANGTVYNHNATPAARFFLVAHDGATLYGTRCQSCHGPLATSERKGATVAQIKTALQSRPEMAGIVLTQRQIEAISFALK